MQAELKLCVASGCILLEQRFRSAMEDAAQSLHALIQSLLRPSGHNLAGLPTVQDTPVVRATLQDHVRAPLGSLAPEARARLRSFRLYLARRFQQEVLLPFAVSVTPALLVPDTAHAPGNPHDTADLTHLRIVSDIIHAGNRQVFCLLRAEHAQGGVSAEALADLRKAIAHYQRAVELLTLQAESEILETEAPMAQSMPARTMAVSARMALLSAKACEGAYIAAQTDCLDAVVLYRQALVALPALEDCTGDKDTVAVLEKLAIYYINAAHALLNSKRAESGLWTEAALTCALAVDFEANNPLGAALRGTWRVFVQHADAIVVKAAKTKAAKTED
jgi:hypothetical protein